MSKHDGTMYRTLSYPLKCNSQYKKPLRQATGYYTNLRPYITFRMQTKNLTKFRNQICEYINRRILCKEEDLLAIFEIVKTFLPDHERLNEIHFEPTNRRITCKLINTALYKIVYILFLSFYLSFQINPILIHVFACMQCGEIWVSIVADWGDTVKKAVNISIVIIGSQYQIFPKEKHSATECFVTHENSYLRGS